MSQPEPQDEGATPAEWLREFVREALRDEPFEDFVRQVNDGILEQIPAIAQDPLLVQDLDEGTAAHWRSFLGLLAEPEYHHELPAQAGHLARSLARRGLDLGVLLKVYRTAHQLVFGYVTEVTGEPMLGSPGRHESLAFVWSRAGAWIDDSIEQLIEIYYEERRRVDQGAQARRSACIEALLVDRAGEDVVAATRDLGHALHHWQTGFVLWSDRTPTSTDSKPFGSAFTDAAGHVARALAAPRPLTHLAGSRDLWGWCATPVAPDLHVLRGLEVLLDQEGLRLAVGIPARGVAGFRTSHTEARAAHGLVVTAVGASRIVDFREVELLCLCAGKPDLMERLVLREIGPLCGADKNLTLLRQTALAFLTHRSVEAAAQELFVHKNTVRYRLSRAEELLGHPLTERAAHTELALRHVALFDAPQADDI